MTEMYHFTDFPYEAIMNSADTPLELNGVSTVIATRNHESYKFYEYVCERDLTVEAEDEAKALKLMRKFLLCSNTLPEQYCFGYQTTNGKECTL